MFNVIGVDIGGTNYRVGLFDHEGRRLMVVEEPTDRALGREWMLEQVRRHAAALAEKSDFPIKACGFSFGGPVDFAAQKVTSLHVPGWNNFEIARWARQELGLESCVDNDANAGARGEFRFGAGRGVRSIFYVTLSTGIGGGLVLDGKPWRGKDHLAGELGHIPVSDSGGVCSCGGRGCLETFCSATAIALRGRGLGERKPETVPRIMEMTGGDPQKVTAEHVFRAAAEGEIGASYIVHEAARWLARGLLMVIRLINPDRIVLGGGVAKAGNTLLDPVRQSIEEMGSPTLRASTEVTLVELGDFSPLYGAAGLALDLVAPTT
jgi:glucokinase